MKREGVFEAGAEEPEPPPKADPAVCGAFTDHQ